MSSIWINFYKCLVYPEIKSPISYRKLSFKLDPPIFQDFCKFLVRFTVILKLTVAVLTDEHTLCSVLILASLFPLFQYTRYIIRIIYSVFFLQCLFNVFCNLVFWFENTVLLKRLVQG